MKLAAAAGCVSRLGLAGAFVLLELTLPAQSARLGSDVLGLGDHAFLLIEDRQARMGQLVVGCDLDEPFADFDCLIKLFLVRVGHGQGMERISIIGVIVKRAQIGGYGIVESVLSEMLHALIVVFFFIHDGDLFWRLRRRIARGGIAATEFF